MIKIIAVILFYSVIFARAKDIPNTSESDKFSPEEVAKNIALLIGQMGKTNKPPSRVMKCTQSCIMKSMNMFTPDMKLSVDNLVKFVGEFTDNNAELMSGASKVGEACNNQITEADHCEAAYLYTGCVFEGMKKVSGSSGDADLLESDKKG